MNKSTKNSTDWLADENGPSDADIEEMEIEKAIDFADDDFDSLADENGPSDADIEEMEIEKAIKKAEKK
jgi:hypothetical protein